MGIKGIYKEIGAGRRIALHRLAVESLETRGRPLRVAIDISIWQFQIQAARGGANPAIRTLFYRLVRLLGMPIDPVFVFDGPNKPAFKRNKRSAKSDGTATAMAKRLIRLFGFAMHDAPGEAEAECALLQQRGVVDAVLSEDVDTIMFGCTRTLRNWSSAKTAATSPPTHVSLYEADSLRQSESGLDREGMVLVALMSGGDYLPEGVPGCGVKLACEAAKAGFGRSLCRLKRSDAAGLASWRTRLVHELRTNESQFFRTCHRKLAIPDQFPNLEILRYYTHPVVSPAEIVERVRADLEAVEPADASVARRPRSVDIPGLRDFVAETFDWADRTGAIRFIRLLAPSLLSRILLLRSSTAGAEDAGQGPDATTDDEWPSVVKGISKQRTHASTDDTPELRVSFIPIAVVRLDLEAENDAPAVSFGRDGLALNSDDEFDEPSPEDADTTGARKAAAYDPTQADVAWVARAVVEMGAPRAVEAWEKQQKPKAGAKGTREKAAGTRKKAAAASSMPAGSLDRYVQATGKAGKDTTADSEPVQPQTATRPKERTRLRRQPPVANPWSLSGSQAPRITKPAVREQLQEDSKASSVSPSKPVSAAAAVVVDLLSSPDEPRTRSPAKTRQTRAAVSPTRSPRKTGIRKTEAAIGSSQMARPPRQKSIRDFLSQPVTVVLSDDEEDGTEKEAGRRTGETGEQSSWPPGVRPPAKGKTVYVPRRSAVGYFREETVEDDGADEKTTGRARRGWRKSEVGMVDLTGLP